MNATSCDSFDHGDDKVTARDVSTINVSNKNIGPEELAALADQLETESDSIPFTKLILGFNCIGDAGCDTVADFFRKDMYITCLDLSFNDIGDEGIKLIADCLAGNRTLRTLHLSGNNLTHDAFESLGQTFKRNAMLHTLHLAGNSGTSRGVEAIASGLTENFTLKNLCLNGNKVCKEGCKALHDLLCTNPTLETISLCDNPIGDAGLELLGQALSRHPYMKAIELSFCKITHKGMESFCKHLEDYKCLEKLQLDNNKIGDKGIKFLVEIIPTMRLIELNVGFNEITADGMTALLQSIEPDQSLESLTLSGSAMNADCSLLLSNLLRIDRLLKEVYLDRINIGAIGEKNVSIGIATNRHSGLKYLAGFHLGHILSQLGSPPKLANMSNKATLRYLKVMWEMQNSDADTEGNPEDDAEIVAQRAEVDEGDSLQSDSCSIPSTPSRPARTALSSNRTTNEHYDYDSSCKGSAESWVEKHHGASKCNSAHIGASDSTYGSVASMSKSRLQLAIPVRQPTDGRYDHSLFNSVSGSARVSARSHRGHHADQVTGPLSARSGVGAGALSARSCADTPVSAGGHGVPYSARSSGNSSIPIPQVNMNRPNRPSSLRLDSLDDMHSIGSARSAIGTGRSAMSVITFSRTGTPYKVPDSGRSAVDAPPLTGRSVSSTMGPNQALLRQSLHNRVTEASMELLSVFDAVDELDVEAQLSRTETEAQSDTLKNATKSESSTGDLRGILDDAFGDMGPTNNEMLPAAPPELRQTQASRSAELQGMLMGMGKASLHQIYTESPPKKKSMLFHEGRPSSYHGSMDNLEKGLGGLHGGTRGIRGMTGQFGLVHTAQIQGTNGKSGWSHKYPDSGRTSATSSVSSPFERDLLYHPQGFVASSVDMSGDSSAECGRMYGAAVSASASSGTSLHSSTQSEMYSGSDSGRSLTRKHRKKPMDNRPSSLWHEGLHVQNMQELPYYIKKAREIAVEPFNPADLWELHQHYFSPPTAQASTSKILASDQAAVGMNDDGGILSDSDDDFLDNATNHKRKAGMGLQRPRVVGGLQPATSSSKRPGNRSTMERIMYYPRLQRYLKIMKADADEGKTLTLLRQLRYLEIDCREDTQDVDIEELMFQYVLS